MRIAAVFFLLATAAVIVLTAVEPHLHQLVVNDWHIVPQLDPNWLRWHWCFNLVQFEVLSFLMFGVLLNELAPQLQVYEAVEKRINELAHKLIGLDLDDISEPPETAMDLEKSLYTVVMNMRQWKPFIPTTLFMANDDTDNEDCDECRSCVSDVGFGHADIVRNSLTEQGHCESDGLLSRHALPVAKNVVAAEELPVLVLHPRTPSAAWPKRGSDIGVTPDDRTSRSDKSITSYHSGGKTDKKYVAANLDVVSMTSSTPDTSSHKSRSEGRRHSLIIRDSVSSKTSHKVQDVHVTGSRISIKNTTVAVIYVAHSLHACKYIIFFC
jgi:hypothetical protein